jgi:DNA-binding NtrC family response regulator
MELEAIRRTLAFTGGDKVKAAELLGINQRTIYRKLPELDQKN